MKLAALIFATLAIARGQVIVLASPEPMIVTDSIPVRVIGLWQILVCNESPTSVRIPPERVYIALRQLPLLAPSSARIVLSRRQAQNKRAIAAMILRYGLLIGTSVTAFGPVAASRNVVGALAFAGSMAMSAERQLEQSVPSILPFTSNLLDAPLELEPNDCTTRTAFAAKMKRPETMYSRIE